MQEKSKPVDNLRADAEKIITRAIAAVLPDAAVERALKGKTFLGRVISSRQGRPRGRWRTPPARVCRIISAAVWS
mgnify:CR=1 FL=1